MKRIRATLLITLTLAVPAFAQDAVSTPETTIPRSEPQVTDIEPGADPVPIDPSPAFVALLTLAGGVAYGLQQLKRAFLDNALANLDEQPRAAVLMAASFVLALIAIYATNADHNILGALGIYPDAPPIVAKLLTAAAVAGGSNTIHAIQTFFRGGMPTAAAARTRG